MPEETREETRKRLSNLPDDAINVGPADPDAPPRKWGVRESAERAKPEDDADSPGR